MPAKLKDKAYWIFDLDNTLYSHECNLFAEVDQKMGDYIMQKFDLSPVEAKKLQKKLYHEYNTTLNGLLRVYNIDAEDYLRFTHDIDYSIIPKNPTLKTMLEKIPGDLFIFTNGPHYHAEAVLKQLGIDGMFKATYDICDANYVPKPTPHIYDDMINNFYIDDASKAIMFDDLAKNLIPASKLGVATVLVEGFDEKMMEGYDEKHISFITDKVENFLAQVFK